MTHGTIGAISPPKLSVRDISKSFRIGGRDKEPARILPVLRGVSFDVHETEIVSLIGASGSGKTTLLRIIQGLMKPDAGDVIVSGRTIAGPGHDRGIVFQQANLLPWRDAEKNVEFGLELKGVAPAARKARSAELLDLVGLGEFARQFPHQLSGGMQQRVGLARALAIDPEILLMDEPFSALDAQTREQLQGELLRIHGRTKKTILFVTHDLDEAVYLSDRVIVMSVRPGRINEIVDIPFSRPRADLTAFRGNREFLELRAYVSELIHPRAEMATG